MKHTIMIDQVRAMEWGLNIQQAAVFDFCYHLPAWADKVILGDEVFYFASRNKAIDELPILTDKPDTVYRIYKQLDEAGLIVWKKIDGKDCIQITRKAAMWNMVKLGNKSEHSEKNPNKLGKFSENGSEKNPTNNNTSIDKSTRDKRERETEKSVSNTPNQKQKFEPPTEEQVKDFFKEKNGGVSIALNFFDHFTSNGWKVGGKTPMKDWRAAARKWMRSEPNFQNNNGHPPKPSALYASEPIVIPERRGPAPDPDQIARDLEEMKARLLAKAQNKAV